VRIDLRKPLDELRFGHRARSPLAFRWPGYRAKRVP
jgi:hypothetical protein